jgi:hypothetical protein|nr:MAG TPA: hypothetical protein [Siphoviridae sp. ctvzh6]
MIIVSQGKTAHINYDNIEVTYLLKKDDKIQINMRGNYDYTIGEYETMERAKEVLQEIIKSYRKYRTAECDGPTKVLQETTVYEMPED